MDDDSERELLTGWNGKLKRCLIISKGQLIERVGTAAASSWFGIKTKTRLFGSEQTGQGFAWKMDFFADWMPFAPLCGTSEEFYMSLFPPEGNLSSGWNPEAVKQQHIGLLARPDSSRYPDLIVSLSWLTQMFPELIGFSAALRRRVALKQCNIQDKGSARVQLF